jgi:hypothetical protein
MKLNKTFDGSLSKAAIRSEFPPNVTTIGAIVTYDEPTETINQQAPYTLTVNGVVQPGG